MSALLVFIAVTLVVMTPAMALAIGGHRPVSAPASATAAANVSVLADTATSVNSLIWD